MSRLLKELYTDPSIGEILRKNPELAQQIVNEYGKLFDYARFIDVWDRITSAVGVSSEIANIIAPYIGISPDILEEVIEMVPKAPFMYMYYGKTKDVEGLLYFILAELESFIPVLGDLIDFENIYTDRVLEWTKKKIREWYKEYH